MELELFVVQACLHRTETSCLPQGIVDIPGTWHLLRFVRIIVLFKVWKQDFSPLHHSKTIYDLHRVSIKKPFAFVFSSFLPQIVTFTI